MKADCPAFLQKPSFCEAMRRGKNKVLLCSCKWHGGKDRKKEQQALDSRNILTDELIDDNPLAPSTEVAERCPRPVFVTANELGGIHAGNFDERPT